MYEASVINKKVSIHKIYSLKKMCERARRVRKINKKKRVYRQVESENGEGSPGEG